MMALHLGARRNGPGTVELAERAGKRRLGLGYKLGLALMGQLLFSSLQVASGASPMYAALVASFAWLAWGTIAVLGGFGTLMGLCVVVLACQHVLFSQVLKLILWQPPDAPLLRPVTTLAMYNVGMGGLLLGALVSTAIVRRLPARKLVRLPDELPALFIASMLLAVLALIRLAIVGLLGQSSGGTAVGGIIGPLRTMTYLTPLAVSTATAWQVKRTAGRRCLGLVNSTMIVAFAVAAIPATARADIALPIVTFLVACWACRYKFKLRDWALVIGAAVVLEAFVFPFSLYSRIELRRKALADQIQLLPKVLGRYVETPDAFARFTRRRVSEAPYASKRLRYFGQDASDTIDRYSVLTVTDDLVDAVYTRGPLNEDTITPGFEMLLPRFVSEDKPVGGLANLIAHHGQGIVSPEDFRTQITMGFFIDAFCTHGWGGLALITSVLGAVYFTLFRLVMDHRLAGNMPAVSLAFGLAWVFSESPLYFQVVSVFQLLPVFIFLCWGVRRLAGALWVVRSQSKTAGLRGAYPS